MPPSHDDRSRLDSSDGHILISGPGRSGTTLLVQYFTALGFDTGYTLDQALVQVDPISRGGLEHSLGRTIGRGSRMPYVAKSPYFGAKLGTFIATGELRVHACLVTLRDLDDAARSRQLASERAAEAGRDYAGQPGGMQEGARNLKHQRRLLAVRFYGLVSALAQHDVPTVFLPFPEFATDHEVLFGRLARLLEEHGVTKAESAEAHARVVDPELIHTFR